MAQTEIETEARSLGWVPKDQFKGDEARWVDAETFVERGHTVMPILKKNNERLERSLQENNVELARVKELLKAGEESIKALQEFNSENAKRIAEKAKRELAAELKTAREEGNTERELEILEGLDNIREAQKAAAVAPVAPADVQKAIGNEAIHPDFKAWMSENTWFGTDNRKTMLMMGIAQQLRADPEHDSLVGRPFYDKVSEIMNERSGGARTVKVDGGRPMGNSGAGSTGVKSGYGTLPADAKAACDRQAKLVVGPGRAFKDIESWRKHYAEVYSNS